MKRIVIFMLSVLLIFTLVACFAGNTPEETEPIGRIITHEDFINEMSKRINLDDYDLQFTDYGTFLDYEYTSKTESEIARLESNFRVKVDGISFTMPLTVKEFVDLGFEIQPVNGEADLPAIARSATLEVKTPEGNTFSVYAISADYSRIPFEDLTVMQISCNFYEGSNKFNSGERKDAPNIQFFENINGEATVDSILKELKVPQFIKFGPSWDGGETTSSRLYMTFRFSNEQYNGDISITIYAVLDEKLDRTSYVTDLSYRIDYESLS